MAGGTGTRMKSEVPKQFLLLHDEPIIVTTIRQFMASDASIEIIVVLPKEHIDHWTLLKNQYPFLGNITTAIGGGTRTDSVKSGLSFIDEDGLVAIHDAVRPFIEPSIIQNSYESAGTNGSGVVAVSLKDSIREIDAKGSIARDRANYVLVQTPQTFKVGEIKKAYEMISSDSFTDDATVYEKAGFTVSLVEGSYANIKITTPEDMK